MSLLLVKPELALDVDLDPEALAVEAVLPALVLAEHRVEAAEDVLVRAAPGVVDAHRVVGGDRARRGRTSADRPAFWARSRAKVARSRQKSRMRCSWAARSGWAGDSDGNGLDGIGSRV